MSLSPDAGGAPPSLEELAAQLDALEEPLLRITHRLHELERRPVGDSIALAGLSKAEVLALILAGNPSAWVNLALSAKVQASTLVVEEPPGARREGACARLRGCIEVKTAEAVKVGETFATVPEAFWPKTAQFLEIETRELLEISAAGLISSPSREFKANQILLLDGRTYPLS
jgi:hypothetical protein